jgi:hypothetical protein
MILGRWQSKWLFKNVKVPRLLLDAIRVTMLLLIILGFTNVIHISLMSLPDSYNAEMVSVVIDEVTGANYVLDCVRHKYLIRNTSRY